MKIIVKNKEYDSGNITEEKYDMVSEFTETAGQKPMYTKAERQLMKEIIVIYYDNQFTVDELMEGRFVDDLIWNFTVLMNDVNEKIEKRVEKYQKKLKKGK